MKNKFKYKSEVFASTVKVIIPDEHDKYLAQASIKNLSPYFPAGLNPDENPDLLYIALPGFNGGIINLNGDGVSIQTAVSLAKKFANKYIDEEHLKGNVVGNLTHYGFAKHATDIVLSEEQALASIEPIDIILSGYLWKVINEDLCDLVVEASDPNSSKYGSISGSWEVLFNDYDIVVGSREISLGRIISDPAEVEKYSKFLRSNGGRGVDKDGNPVYRMIKGDDIVPAGIGLVSSPAGFVKGVSILSGEDEIEKQKDDAIKSCVASNNHGIVKCSCGEIISQCRCGESEVREVIEQGCASCQEKKLVSANEKEQIEKENENNLKKISLLAKNRVNKDTNLNSSANLVNNKLKINKKMKLKFKDINEDMLETLASKEVYEAALEIDKKLTEFAEQRDAEIAASKEKEQKAIEAQETLDKVSKELEQVKADLQKEQDARVSIQVQADFNSRMSELNDKFDITEAWAKIIAKDIRGLDKEGYAAWLTEHEPVLVAKKKDADKDKDKDKDKEVDADDDVEAAMDDDNDGDNDSDNSDDDTDKSENKKKKKKKAKSSSASYIELLEKAQVEATRHFNTIVPQGSNLADIVAEAFKDIEVK